VAGGGETASDASKNSSHSSGSDGTYGVPVSGLYSLSGEDGERDSGTGSSDVAAMGRGRPMADWRLSSKVENLGFLGKATSHEILTFWIIVCDCDPPLGVYACPSRTPKV
jgi:hypothetical protein